MLNKDFLINEETYITTADIYNTSKELKGLIESRNLILLISDNSIEAIAYYLSILLSDNVSLIISSNTKDDWISDYLLRYKPDYLCIHKDTLKNYSHDFRAVIHNWGNYVLMNTKNGNTLLLHKELALLLPTSGSTGSPRLVRISKQNLINNTESIIKSLKITKNDRAIMTLPMSYTYGLSVINTHFYTGASIFVSSKSIIQAEFWKLFKDFSCTGFSGVPYTYEMLYRFGFLKRDVGSLKTMTQAGGKLKDDLIYKFAQFSKDNSIQFFIMYGQTEATARMTCLPYEYLWKGEKMKSVGPPVNGGEIKIRDMYTNVYKQPFEEGEIIYTGNNVSMGYAESREDLSRGDDFNKKLYTGDIGYLDEDGFLYVTGRIKRFIKLYGNRYNLDEMEKKLRCYLKDGADITITEVNNKILVLSEDNRLEYIKQTLSNEYHINKNDITVNKVIKIPRLDNGKRKTIL